MSDNDKDNIKELAGQYAENLKDTLQTIRAYLEEHKAELEELARAQKEIERLLPFLAAELKTAQAQGEAPADMLPEDLLAYMTPSGVPLDSPYKAIITAAIAAAGYKPKRVENIEFPIEAVYNKFFKSFSQTPPNGQLKLNTDTDLENSNIVYGLSYDDLPGYISKQITPFDRRVYTICNTLQKKYDAFSITQLYHAMGNRGDINATAKKKINDSLTKMRAAIIYINNAEESEATGYPPFEYEGMLLPLERLKIFNKIKGDFDEYISISCKPGTDLPLIRYARLKKHVTIIPQKLLESPRKKTAANLLIDDYLIERISHMKNEKKRGQLYSTKISFKTLYENCDITTTKQKQRAPEKIKEYLEHYKSCKEWIKGYQMKKDGVIIIL